MRSRWLTLLLGVAGCAAAANAQVGIYAKFDTARVTASSAGSSAQTSVWFKGPSVGIYYDFLHLGPIALGADVRGNRLSGNQQNYRSALFGLRLALKPPAISIKPYVQASVGVGGPTHTGLNGVGSIYSNKFQYQILGGIDTTLIPHLDFRAVEFGYARMSGISSGSPAPVATVLTISTGFVLRF